MLGPPASGKLMLPTRLRGTNSTYPVMLLSAINLLVSSFLYCLFQFYSTFSSSGFFLGSPNLQSYLEYLSGKGKGSCLGQESSVGTEQSWKASWRR